MTLPITSNFLSELGTCSLQGNSLQLQPPSRESSLPEKTDRIPSAPVSLSENTIKSNALYQSLVNGLNIGKTESPELKANDIAGIKPKLADYALAHVTRDVYRPYSLGISGYTRLSDDELTKAGIDPDSLNDRSTGFQAGVYKKEGLYVVSFTGSNEPKDFMASIRQGLGYNESQYNQAIELAYNSLKSFGENVIFTGHSLGGGLATAAALATGKPAVIYNSSGVSDATMKRMGIVPEIGRELADSGLIRHYTVEHDWLGSLQKILPVPQPMGHEIAFEYELGSIFGYGLHAFKAHLLETITELMTINKPWLDNKDVTKVEQYYMV
ncbi:phospholipase [Xenorhabdus sp. 42]|uniref:phospholipase n=1 Tax=Xenorhabdus szentirmaii TaxID=290112 RepID=UPI0019A66127|nr:MULTISPECIES: phospholipase [unclassified Xenorhabdus]MBD2794126.1 phospholipase [Xenorhabdus sp. CUL]MBD2820537.1 phospholipase [Xenorhabdus sp. 42]MBD2826064.1 phospholipase [Xenorhabdus sp. 5]